MTTAELTNITTLRGAGVPTDARMSVIVMSVDSEPTTPRALASLLDGQTHPVEIVVVNTGAGSLRTALVPYLDRITFIETPTRQFAGGARNLGIRASKAPLVAFLAADCLAPPDWIEKRLAAHDNGHPVVASALLPAPTNGRVSRASVASYLVTHFRRVPGIPLAVASRCGLSYERRLFELYGLFDETLRISEDSEFNERIAHLGEPYWSDEITTLHNYPSSLWAAVRDQYHRGKRAAQQENRSLVRFALGRMKGNLTNYYNARKGGFPKGVVLPSLAAFLLVAASHSVGVLVTFRRQIG